MKSSTVLNLFYTFFLVLITTLPVAAGITNIRPLSSDPIEDTTLPRENLNKLLFCQLRTDQLIDANTQLVKIEFEYHDIFVNEQILSYELIAKYQQLLRENGIEPGPQRQIHLEANGKLLIGDFGQYGELVRETPLPYPSEI